jgi:hypothetical protein
LTLLDKVSFAVISLRMSSLTSQLDFANIYRNFCRLKLTQNAAFGNLSHNDQSVLVCVWIVKGNDAVHYFKRLCFFSVLLQQ